MPGAIGRNGPWGQIAVLDFKIDVADLVAEPNRAFGGQIVGVGADDIGNAVDFLNVGGRFGDHEDCTSLKYRVRRECVVDVAAQPVTANVFVEGIRVIDFDEVQDVAVRAGRGLVVDFGDDETGFAARRPGWFDGGTRVADGCADGIAIIAKLGNGGRRVGGMTASGGAQIKRVGYGDGSRTELGPELAVVTAIASENIANA